jgi:hypothetical protein
MAIALDVQILNELKHSFKVENLEEVRLIKDKKTGEHISDCDVPKFDAIIQACLVSSPLHNSYLSKTPKPFLNNTIPLSNFTVTMTPLEPEMLRVL